VKLSSVTGVIVLLSQRMTPLILPQPVAHGQMYVDLSGREEAVAKEILEGVEIDSGFVHVGGVGVAERA
tara:strand:+ start:613 stop:819 length:207 start_codon:yes stop_codon:yes gene_type:complete